MRLALTLAGVVLLASGPGCESASKPSAGKSEPAEPEPAEPEPEPEPEPVKPEPVKPDLPGDLEGLAEMPELTAEATDAEIERRVDRVLDELTAFIDLIGEQSDCAKMGRSLSRFADVNQRFLANLEKLDKPGVQKRLSDRITKRGATWLGKMADNLQRCIKHPEVMMAITKLAQQQK